MRVETSLIIACFSAASLSGQSLTVPRSETSLNTPGEFLVLLKAPPDRVPVGLQWDLSIPPVIAVRTEDIRIGEAAHAAGKSLTCALRQVKKASRRMRYTCILVGGGHPLTNGPIAYVQYRAKWDLKGAPVEVEIENVIGVSRDLQRIPMANVDVDIRIR